MFAQHTDIWYTSAKPFDPLLRMSAQNSQSALQSTIQRGADFVSKALSCSLDFSHLHLIRNQSPTVQKVCVDIPNDHELLHCMNSLCRQRGIQMVALRDLKLTDLEPVVHLFKYRMKVSVGYILIKGPYTNYVDKQGHTIMPIIFLKHSESCFHVWNTMLQKLNSRFI